MRWLHDGRMNCYEEISRTLRTLPSKSCFHLKQKPSKISRCFATNRTPAKPNLLLHAPDLCRQACSVASYIRILTLQVASASGVNTNHCAHGPRRLTRHSDARAQAHRAMFHVGIPHHNPLESLTRTYFEKLRCILGLLAASFKTELTER